MEKMNYKDFMNVIGKLAASVNGEHPENFRSYAEQLVSPDLNSAITKQLIRIASETGNNVGYARAVYNKYTLKGLDIKSALAITESELRMTNSGKPGRDLI